MCAHTFFFAFCTCVCVCVCEEMSTAMCACVREGETESIVKGTDASASKRCFVCKLRSS